MTVLQGVAWICLHRLLSYNAIYYIDKLPIGKNLKWLVEKLKTITIMWRPLRDTMKKIVQKNCDREDAKAINEKLDKVSPYCVCESDYDRISQMVKFLEEEVETVKIFKWFKEVLEHDDIKRDRNLDDTKRQQLIRDIEEKLKNIDPYGPVNED